MKPNHLALLLALLCLVTLPVFAAQEGTFDRTLKVSGPIDLDVTTGSGSITVNRGSESQVVVHATIRASVNGWLSGDPSARIKAIQDNPPVEQNGNVIRIGHFYDSERQRNISISYDIQVPADVRLHSRTGSGHIKIARVNGPVDASTGSGGIDIDEVASDVRLQTGSGSIAINNIAGTVRAHTGSGSIGGDKIGGFSAVNTSAKFQGKALPLASAGSTGSGAGRAYLDFETGSGNIRLLNIAGELKAHTGSGSIEAQGQQTGDWDLNTCSGGIRVRLPESSKFNLMARTSSGSVSTDFPLTIQGTVNRRELSGSVNGGGPRLDLHTGSGSIHVEK
jgi:DUF4097 and DUF4098 domain-containing protein YvlB